MDQGEINSRFGFHKATIEGPEATKPRHVLLRRAFLAFVSDLNKVLPENREASLAFTNLEDASMWAHKAVAKNAPLEVEEEPTEGFDEETMHRVYKALLDSGMTGDQASNSIREMQNKGILFREIRQARKPEHAKPEPIVFPQN